MLTTVMVCILFILVCFLFFYSKQGMLKKLFTNELSYPASELKDQLELTADAAIKNFENHITRLEDLIGQAESSIALLDEKIQLAQQVRSEGQAIDVPFGSQQVVCHEEKIAAHSVPVPYGVAQYRQHITNNEFITADKDEQSAVMNSSHSEVNDNQNQTQEPAYQPISQQRHVILAMFKQGYTITEIAKVTGFGQGAVQLFLELHKND